MDWLDGVGSVASIVGLAATLFTLYKVSNLPAALKQRSRHKQLSDLIDKIAKIPQTKPEIPGSTAREVEVQIRTIRLYEVSRLPFRQGKLKSLLVDLEKEINGQKQFRVVLHQLQLIRDEVTIR